MKTVWTLLLTMAIASLAAQGSLNVMTFNIRMDTERDSANAWPHRKDLAASQILFHEVDILGVQEAFHHQMEDLRQRLPGYASHGVGRDDGQTKGEHSAIFYNSKRLQKLAGSTFWLSTTPTVPGSKGWDAQITRIVSWIKLKDLRTQKIFFVFNTHFDHIGQEARRQSAHLVLHAVDSIAGKMPAIVTGDFNASPSEEPIQVIVNPADPLRLTDTKAISATPHYGPEGTFTAFGPKELTNEPIDHIFIKGNWKVLQHATLSQSWGGRFSSDHFPVFARVEL